MFQQKAWGLCKGIPTPDMNQQLLIQLPPTKKVQTQPREIYVELLKQQKHQQKQNLQEKSSSIHF